ncbi:hypothetical protein HDF16_003231 [Granulicella aggregans]|uniref:Uncharacterized protein n=1 Tax=Granulicella aggregans TaxID=474949 RepID=A0A7W8E4D5_9BACT|nr:hypothetical protein [Granulicella aggregans]MBB5058517.1 hypothetical protein [Granulicella aggregans]
MTLLNAPAYNTARENLKRNVIVGAIVAILLGSVLAVLGYVLGHGWFFTNLPVEHHVKVFMETVQSGDYAKAYGIWENDADWQQHPQKYDYKLQRFTEDWSTASDWGGPVKTFHIDVSKRDKTGVVVAVTINGKKRFFVKRESKDGTLDYFPNEIVY